VKKVHDRVEHAGVRTRWPWLDAWRGFAVAAMAIYHFTWDLAFFSFIPGSALRSGLFVFSGHAIACSFLGIAGFALAIASRPALDMTQFSKRLVKLVAAAVLVTVATWIAFPATFVSFGILHCIAAASLISLAFIRAQAALTLIAGVAIFFAGIMIAIPAFDLVNGWIGLGERIPLTNDWRPIFPWSGAMLIGLAAGQFVLDRKLFAQPESQPPRVAVVAGQHSLLIYLVHQPLLFGLVWLAAQIWQPAALAGISQEPFITACAARCEQTRSESAFCLRACNCIAEETKSAGLWTEIARGNLTASGQARYDEIIALCRK
jgi:uncharacterized membrane protein